MMKKTNLSSSCQHLIRIMQGINFGRIEGLIVQGGEPVLDPPPRVIREHKFSGENEPRPEAAKYDFELKSQVCELVEQFKKMGEGTILFLEVKHGLPFRMTVEEDAA